MKTLVISVDLATHMNAHISVVALLHPDNEMFGVHTARVNIIKDMYTAVEEFVAAMLKKAGDVDEVVPVVAQSENAIVAEEIEKRIVAVWKEHTEGADD